MEDLIKYIIDYLAIMPKEIALVFLATLPITELRGSIPIGILLFKMHPFKTFVFSCIGNALPVLPLLFFYTQIERGVCAFPFSRKIYLWYIERVQKKAKKMERINMWGLAAFVSIPLPVTGAWTGSVIAFLLGMEKRKAMVAISAGIVIAGILVTLLTLTGYSCYSFLNSK